jgi:hypothetical protein
VPVTLLRFLPQPMSRHLLLPLHPVAKPADWSSAEASPERGAPGNPSCVMGLAHGARRLRPPRPHPLERR